MDAKPQSASLSNTAQRPAQPPPPRPLPPSSQPRWCVPRERAGLWECWVRWGGVTLCCSICSLVRDGGDTVCSKENRRLQRNNDNINPGSVVGGIYSPHLPSLPRRLIGIHRGTRSRQRPCSLTPAGHRRGRGRGEGGVTATGNVLWKQICTFPSQSYFLGETACTVRIIVCICDTKQVYFDHMFL